VPVRVCAARLSAFDDALGVAHLAANERLVRVADNALVRRKPLTAVADRAVDREQLHSTL
jgi:hypothetical protein